jgi:hypothetical protein
VRPVLVLLALRVQVLPVQVLPVQEKPVLLVQHLLRA